MRGRIAGTVAWAVASGLLLACGGAGGGGDGGGGATLTLNPASAVVQAGSGPVAFYANLTGSSDSVSWSVSPTGVGTLVAGVAGMPAYYTPPASVAATTVVTITASAAGLTRNATVTVNPAGVVPALTVVPVSRTVTAGDQPVSFTATLVGSVDPITWTRTPAVGDLSPLTGPLVWYTAPASVAARTVVALTATAGSLSASATIAVNPASGGTVDLAGHAYFDDGTAAAGARVLVSPGGHAADVAADGSFSVPGVTTPYDLTVAAAAQRAAVVVAGLTRPDPTVVVEIGVPPAPWDNQGTIQGALVLPSGCASAPSCRSLVAFASPGVAGGSGEADPAYQMTLEWSGPSPATGDLHALQCAYDASGDITAAWYGKKTGVSVANGGITAVDFAAGATSPVSLGSLSGTVAPPPAGYGYLPGATLWLELPYARLAILVATSGLDAGPFSYPVPAVAGATFGGSVAAQGPSGEWAWAFKTGAAAGATHFDIALQEAPHLQVPPDGSTGVTYGTAFSWAPFPGGVHRFGIFPLDPSDPTITIVTPAASASIPDLRSVSAGLGLRAGAGYAWSVDGIAPATPDDLAGEAGFAVGGDHWQGQSEERSFTAQ